MRFPPILLIHLIIIFIISMQFAEPKHMDSEDISQEIFGYGINRKGRCYSSCCDPRHRPYRYIIASLLLIAYSCVYFTIELPTGLQTSLLSLMNINAKQYNLLFSIFTWPDVILSVFGGLLVDRVIGIRAGLLLVSTLSLVGEAIFVIGGFANSYAVALLGRVVLGCGLGLFKNTIFVLIALWFKGKEINLIASLSTCASRTGTSLGIVLPQIVYRHLNFIPSKSFRMGCTFSLGVLAMLVAAIVSVVAVLLDTRGAKIVGLKTTKRKFDVRDLKDFSALFWLSTLSLAIFYGVLYSYAANGQLFVTSKFGFDTSEANLANVLIFTGPIIVTPFIGIFLDFMGYNIVWAAFGLSLALAAHLLYAGGNGQMPFVPFLAGTMYSLSYSIFTTAVYPIPVFIVQEHQLTTAYSLYNMEYCLSFSLISLFTGFFIDYFGFLLLEAYFIALMSLALVLLIAVIMIDFSQDCEAVLLVPGLVKGIKKKGSKVQKH